MDNLNNNDCSICLAPYNISDSRELSCKHRFHPQCIAQWEGRALEVGPSCPMCRKIFDTAMEEAERFTTWYDSREGEDWSREQEGKKRTRRIILCLAAPIVGAILGYGIARLAVTYFTSLNRIGTLLNKICAATFAGAMLGITRDEILIREEVEKIHPEKTIEKTIGYYNHIKNTKLTLTDWGLYTNHSSTSIEEQIDLVLNPLSCPVAKIA